MIAVLALAFNVFPGGWRIFVFHGNEGTVYPLLAPEFDRYSRC